MQYYQEGCQGLLGWWQEGDPVAQSVDGGRRGCWETWELWSGGVVQVIDLFPSLPAPLPWQDVRGPRQRAAPFSVGCHPPRRKGFREVAWGS